MLVSPLLSKRVLTCSPPSNLALPYSAICGSAPGLVMSSLASFIITCISASSAFIFAASVKLVHASPTSSRALFVRRRFTCFDADADAAPHLLAEPDNYDWHATRAIALSDSSVPHEGKVVGGTSDVDVDLEKKDQSTGETMPVDLDEMPSPTVEEQAASNAPVDLVTLQRTFVRACWISGLFSFVIAIVIPFPLFFSHYIFSKRFFEAWCGVSLAWVLLAGIFCMCAAVLPFLLPAPMSLTFLARTAFSPSGSRAGRCLF